MDYVIVGAGPSLAEVTQAVIEETGSVERNGWLYPSNDDQAALHVIADPEIAGGHVVQVLRAGEPISARQELARKIYDRLAKRTDWDLTLDSDDTEDVIASRTKSRT
ncbi:hypothetical protein ACT16_06645 [Mycobacterium heckeshornense]|nr:hypothetical protein ACT16_06645 [Mycobacterium heckeshornense]